MNERMKEVFEPPYSVCAPGILDCSLTVSIASEIKRNCSGKLAQVMPDMVGSQKKMVVLLLSSF